MVDPTSDLNEDVPEEEAPECAVCGESLAENPDHLWRRLPRFLAGVTAPTAAIALPVGRSCQDSE
ncbi:hypothetical protein BRC74_06180 [Halobacteriales archaeon QH_7_68_42]|nr:MAG: hypothetical protein BRC74_06180 [Halobacteriales archaeon QH_7_68_42]